MLLFKLLAGLVFSTLVDYAVWNLCMTAIFGVASITLWMAFVFVIIVFVVAILLGIMFTLLGVL